MARGVSFSGGAELPGLGQACAAGAVPMGWARSRQGRAGRRLRPGRRQSRGRPVVLAGPTGERNSYQILPREAVLSLAGMTPTAWSSSPRRSRSAAWRSGRPVPPRCAKPSAAGARADRAGR